MNILLVLGSVTAKQYDRARLELKRQGMVPKVVRVPSNLATRELLVDRAIQQASDRQLGEGSAELYIPVRLVELEKECLLNLLGGTSLSDVAAVVIELDDDLVSNRWSWVLDHLNRMVPVHRIQRSDHGELYLELAELATVS